MGKNQGPRNHRNIAGGPLSPQSSVLSPDLTIGVDLGGTKILAAVVDSRGRVRAEEKIATREERGPQEVLKRIMDCIEAVQAASPGAVEGIGVGCPGSLDLETGTVVFSPNLRGWENFPLARRLRDRFALPVLLGNDVNVGALGEFKYGAGRHLGEQESMVALFVGTGIGGGIILNGGIWEGDRGIAGEIGHMVIDRESPMVCGCGNRGCLEVLASRTAIDRRIRARLGRGERSVIKSVLKKNKPLKSSVVADAVRQKDNLVKQELGQACQALGIGIANIINIIDPHLVVLGGGIMEALGDQLLAPIRRVVSEYVLPHPRAPARLVLSELGDRAGVIGASELARLNLPALHGGQAAGDPDR